MGKVDTARATHAMLHDLSDQTPCPGFGTSISPWIVTLDALEPFSCAPNTTQDPVPFEHLRWSDTETGALDIKLKIDLIRERNPLRLPLSFSAHCLIIEQQKQS